MTGFGQPVPWQIEPSDVGTQFTTLRYADNWKGAPGFVMTKTLALVQGAGR